ncbi:hypothetical protein BaRGS_00025083 [Batillaria attramentaria]|uniref:Uncharacterized protein n=1 Tax=Batillaria attramentaria TaxID=370345 RepID=A0ABD0K9C5_9CAEN
MNKPQSHCYISIHVKANPRNSPVVFIAPLPTCAWLFSGRYEGWWYEASVSFPQHPPLHSAVARLTVFTDTSVSGLATVRPPAETE